MTTKSIERTKELLDQLKERIDLVQSSEDFKNVLAAMAKFHKYSWRNSLLIFMQCPCATKVAGYRAWQKMGRSVSKGQKAIWIFAPMLFKRKDEDEEDEEQVITMFRPVPVFDYGQTEGEPLPSLETQPITNTHEGLLEKLKELSDKLKIEITLKELPGMDGVSKIGEIVIDSRKNPTEQSLILLHELAHEIIHDTKTKRVQLTNEQKELEAETTAWLVAQQLGLPEMNSDKYLAIYQKSYDLMESLQVIHTTSQSILKSIAPDREADQNL